MNVPSEVGSGDGGGSGSGPGSGRGSGLKTAREAVALAREAEEDANEACNCQGDEHTLIGLRVRTRNGRMGEIIQHDPDDTEYEVKVEFTDGKEGATVDWMRLDDVFAIECEKQGQLQEEEGELFELPAEE